MQGNWLKVGKLLINADRIVAINTQAGWAVDTGGSQDADGGYVPGKKEGRRGVEIIIDIDPGALPPKALGLDDQGQDGGLLKLRYVSESKEARQLRQQCDDNS